MFKKANLLIKTAAVLFISGAAFLGCESATGSGDPNTSDVTLQFTTTGSPAKISSNAISTHDTLKISGTNGSLEITDIRFIVEEFELERADVECEDLEGEAEDECEEFESDPIFVDLPLHADTLNLNTTPIEPGLYEELEFEVDDLELDEEDAEEQDIKQQLINQVRTEFPDWPDEVSMVLIGEFVSPQGIRTSFKTYVEADIEIELEFNPPLEVTEDAISKLVKINIDPNDWFTNADGTVIDLSVYDYDTTGQVLQFEVEIENGFDSIKVEDDDDEEDDD